MECATSYVWTDECQELFITLRKGLRSAPVLVYPNFNTQFILDTDASDTEFGGVLSQLDSQGKWRIIVYGSHLLTKQECQYCVTRRELLVVVVAFTHQYRPQPIFDWL